MQQVRLLYTLLIVSTPNIEYYLYPPTLIRETFQIFQSPIKSHLKCTTMDEDELKSLQVNSMNYNFSAKLRQLQSRYYYYDWDQQICRRLCVCLFCLSVYISNAISDHIIMLITCYLLGPCLIFIIYACEYQVMILSPPPGYVTCCVTVLVRVIVQWVYYYNYI